ncbi:virescein-like [Maniola jurtina]|uniref:virescein-like n=1 Tax=Maniola jurtina TaxID=191418 RepID=UPI001E68A07F|nr:virescein-like [Maniola jurtina]
MKLTAIFVFIMAVLALFVGHSEADPKVNVKSIKKGGKIIGHGLRAINIASTAHDIASMFRRKRKH